MNLGFTSLFPASAPIVSKHSATVSIWETSAMYFSISKYMPLVIRQKNPMYSWENHKMEYNKIFSLVFLKKWMKINEQTNQFQFLLILAHDVFRTQEPHISDINITYRNHFINHFFELQPGKFLIWKLIFIHITHEIDVSNTERVSVRSHSLLIFECQCFH